MLNDLYHAIDPIAFSIGPFAVRWYGLAYVLGFALAAIILYRTAKRWRLRVPAEAVLTIMICVIVGIIVGARLGYCLVYGNGYYLAHPLEILMTTQGGMSFHGGLAGALIAGIVAAKVTGIPYLTLCDLGVIGGSIGLFFGRCANFVNGELWGAPTDWPIGVVFGGVAGSVARHPSQLYEGVLEGLVIFCVLYLLSRKVPPRPRGTFLGLFLVMYGAFRFLIEFVREPDVQLGYLFGGWVTMGQLLSIPLVVVGVAVLAYAFRMRLPQEGVPADSDLFGMEEVPMQVKFYKCEVCGNIAVKVVDDGPALVCCGQKMTEMVPNSTDAAGEKHIPAVSIDDMVLHVNIGEVDHPMDPDHFIQFICLATEVGYEIHPLEAGTAPATDFVLSADVAPVAVYEYCNKHGLWMREL